MFLQTLLHHYNLFPGDLFGAALGPEPQEHQIIFN